MANLLSLECVVFLHCDIWTELQTTNESKAVQVLVNNPCHLYPISSSTPVPFTASPIPN